MEGREGSVAGGHEGGLGLFRADVSMKEAQEAAKEYQSSPSSPSTSPTPSPPPAAAGHGGDATAAPPAWSLGGEKPSEAAGDNGIQMPGLSEHASLSSTGRRRGRPRASGRRQILATLGEWHALSAGGSFTPHVIVVAAGEDVAASIMSFSKKGPRSVCILAANGTISNVALNQPGSSGSNNRLLLRRPQRLPPLPLVLTVAMPISQAAPGDGCHEPPVSAARLQAHASVELPASGATNLNSSSTGFTMGGWPVSSQSMGQHRPSPKLESVVFSF